MTNQLPFISPTHLNLSTEGLAKLVVGTVGSPTLGLQILFFNHVAKLSDTSAL